MKEYKSIIIYRPGGNPVRASTHPDTYDNLAERIEWELDEVYIKTHEAEMTYFKIPYQAKKWKVEDAQQESK